MGKKDEFGRWFRKNMEEETRGVFFSTEAKARVRKEIFQDSNSNGFKDQDKKFKASLKSSRLRKRWWQDEISLSLKAVSFCLVTLLIIGLFYTGNFFYVSPQQLAKYEMREKIILHDGTVPFGAVQHRVAYLDSIKGVGKS
jgi:hypothetical protein